MAPLIKIIESFFSCKFFLLLSKKKPATGPDLFQPVTKSGLYFIIVADPDAGSIVLMSHGSGMEKNQDTRSGINLSDHISESLVTSFV